MREKFEQFLSDFLKGLTNERGGQSLKKWLAIGFFWLTCVLCLRYTTDSNFTMVLGIIVATILALMGINQLGKQSMRKLDDPKSPPPGDDPEDNLGKQ